MSIFKLGFSEGTETSWMLTFMGWNSTRESTITDGIASFFPEALFVPFCNVLFYLSRILSDLCDSAQAS